MEVQNLKTKSLVQQTADKIYKMITKDNIFKPGEQLPNELILSTQLGVSRSTLREAIRTLALQGILDVYRGKGTFISSNMTSFRGFGLESMERIRVQLKDLLEARLLFEPELTALVCKRATDDELYHIFDLGKETEKLILAGEDRTEIDTEFHKAIVAASHNEFLQHLMPILTKSINDAIQLNNGCKLPSEDILASNTLRDHALLMEFLKSRDANGAKYAMSIHIRHTINNLNLNTEDEPIF